MVGLIQKCKPVIPSEIRQFCSGRKLDKPKHYLLVRQNDKLNYKLIKYICNKNFYNQAKNEQLSHDYSENNNNQDELNAQSFLEIAKKLKNASNKLSSKINKRLKEIDNINILLFNGGILHKGQIHKALEALRVHCIFYNARYHGLAQQEWFSSFIRKNLRIILSQGKLKKTKITDQEANKLISENKEVLRKLEKHSGNRQQKISLKTREIIFEEIKQRRIQQLSEEFKEVSSIMCSNAKKYEKLTKSTKVLLGTTKNTTKVAEEFSEIAKKVNHKTANNKILFYTLAVVVAIAVTALICYCIYTTFSKPIQSLDNVELMQNMGKLINSIT